MNTQTVTDNRTTGGLDQSTSHSNAVSVDGLEDLFRWASNMVSDGVDTRVRKAQELHLKRQIFEIISRNKDNEIHEKYSQEISYLQRRTIALLQVVLIKIQSTINSS